MSQPPYGPPPQGPPASGPGQPPYGSPQGQPYYPAAEGQPLYQPPQGGAPTPWYKKPWAIVVGALLAIGLIASAVNDKDEASSSADAAPSTTTAESSAAAPPPSSQAAAPPPATTPPTTTPPPAAPAPPAGVNFTMPDFVGMDLQSAQNLVQTHGVFLSRSHDLLGSRNQLLDSNWIVCDQNIPAGQQVTGDAEGLIDFGVVQREEFCP